MYNHCLIEPTNFLKKIVVLSFYCIPLLIAGAARSQDLFKGNDLFTVPKQYTATMAVNPPVIDGDLKDKVWSGVPWTTDFTDIEGNKQPAPYQQTRCKMIWDKDYLYIAAEVKESNIWAYVKNHDEVIFQDNDFEVFIDPLNTAHQYFELEVNAINTMWDLFLPKPYRSGGDGLSSWESGVRSGVKVQGTVNDPSDKDKSWTVEMAIPYTHLNLKKSPENGDFWRINFSRVQWGTTVSEGKYVKNTDAAGKTLPEHNWVWSPQGLINMHYPERWGYLNFSTATKGAGEVAIELPFAEKQRNYLWLVYYRQKEYMEKQGRYAGSLKELGIAPEFTLDSQNNTLDMEATNHQFFLSVKTSNQSTITINQDGLIQIVK